MYDQETQVWACGCTALITYLRDEHGDVTDYSVATTCTHTSDECTSTPRA